MPGLVATLGTLVVGYIGDRTMQRSLTAMWSCLFFAVALLPAAFLLDQRESRPTTVIGMTYVKGHLLP